MKVQRFNKIVEELSKDVPIKVLYKTDSKLMKLISFFLFFNKGFMDLYITTIGNTVYYPSREYIKEHPTDASIVMAHEYVHMMDNKRLGPVYPFLYLFPQVLGLLSLLSVFAFITPVALFFLPFALCFSPLPAPGRKYLEVRGYKMTLYFLYLLLKEHNKTEEDIREQLHDAAKMLSEYFTNSAYYFMWPMGVQQELLDFANTILSEDLSESSDVYRRVTAAFNASKDS